MGWRGGGRWHKERSVVHIQMIRFRRNHVISWKGKIKAATFAPLHFQWQPINQEWLSFNFDKNKFSKFRYTVNHLED